MVKKELQSLAGKLQFAACCMRPGQVFISRIYDVMSEMEDGRQYWIQEQVRKDITWWYRFMSGIQWSINNVDAAKNCGR